jgi:hypothetical protein
VTGAPVQPKLLVSVTLMMVDPDVFQLVH